MRFFFIACLFGIIVASLGQLTRNWSSPLMERLYNNSQLDAVPMNRVAVSEVQTERGVRQISQIQTGYQSNAIIR